jgi:tripartite-type tricarboxylate transporter receptor subunit TctC
MPFHPFARFLTAAFTTATALSPACSAAQSDWPSRPITIVVPYSPGGAADAMGRMVARHLSQELKQTVVVENRPGAGIMLGSQFVARARPDGYTFLVGGGPNVLHQFIYRNVPYDLKKDLRAVAQLSELPNYMVAHPGRRFRSVADVLQRAREQPGTVTCAHYGTGTSGHLGCEMLASLGGVKLVNVAYRGGVPAIQDTLGGQVDIAMVVEALPYIQDKRLTGLGVSTTARSPHAPDIPAIAETLPGYDVTPWQGIFAPAGTPDDRVARVGAAIQAMLQDEASQAQMKTLGVIPAWRNAAEMDAYVDLETKRWGKVIPPLNIQLD